MATMERLATAPNGTRVYVANNQIRAAVVVWAARARLAAPKQSRGKLEVGWVGGWRGDAVAFRFQSPPVEPFMWNST